MEEKIQPVLIEIGGDSGEKTCIEKIISKINTFLFHLSTHSLIKCIKSASFSLFSIQIKNNSN